MGWTGVIITALAIVTKNTQWFIYSQLIGAISALLYDRFLIRRFSISSLIAFSIGVLAAIVSSEWILYSSILARTINYQLVFISMLRSGRFRPDQGK